MEDNGLNQKKILCLESKYLLPGFNMKGNPMVVLPHDRETYEGRLFYAIVIKLR